MAGILKVDKYQDFNGNDIMTSDGSGTITMPSGIISGQNYPAFEAYLSSNQDLTDNVYTKIQFDTEVFDTDGCYDNATNYRFTPNVAGKYYVYFGIRLQNGDTADIILDIDKNGSTYRNTYFDPVNSQIGTSSLSLNAIIDMNGSSDYLECFVNFDVTSGTPVAQAGTKSTYFGAYRIGA